MKLTESMLRQIIKEEVEAALEEAMPGDAVAGELMRRFGLEKMQVISLLKDPAVKKALAASLFPKGRDPSITRMKPKVEKPVAFTK